MPWFSQLPPRSTSPVRGAARQLQSRNLTRATGISCGSKLWNLQTSFRESPFGERDRPSGTPLPPDDWRRAAWRTTPD
jgi:hypothetical protein